MDFKLVPGAYRTPEPDHFAMFHEFREKAHGLMNRPPSTEMEWYFVAQHYGIPTRLLDWSESPLVALYFAVRDLKPGERPCVWMMYPETLNGLALGSCGMLSFGGHSEIIDLWSPRVMQDGHNRTVKFMNNPFFAPGEQTITNDKPIAIFPPRATERITAQRGVFTLHGKDKRPISEIFEQDTEVSEMNIVRIEIKNPAAHLATLMAMGLDDFNVFPELSHLAVSIKQRHRLIRNRKRFKAL